MCTTSEVMVSSRPDLGLCPVGRYLAIAQATFDACDAQEGGSSIPSVARGLGLLGPQLREWRPTSYLPTRHGNLKDCVFIYGEQGGMEEEMLTLVLMASQTFLKTSWPFLLSLSQ